MAAALLPLSFLSVSTHVVNIRGMIKFLGIVITQALKAVVTVLRQRNHVFIPAEINSVSTTVFARIYAELCYHSLRITLENSGVI